MSTKLARSVVPTVEICPNCKSEMTITEVTPILVFSASIFSQRASTAIADTVNEFTNAICWKRAVEPDVPWPIAITQLWNRPLISNMGTANRLSAAYRRFGVGDDLRRQ